MAFTPIIATPPACGWTQLKVGDVIIPRPVPVVSGFAIDENGYFPIMYRGSNVRSAPDCWALPSGLHEVGLTFAQQFANELYEELGLNPYPQSAIHIGTYENILPDGYHWCLQVMVMRVESLDCLVNKEPDKHPEIRQIRIRRWQDQTQWAPNLGLFISRHLDAIDDAIEVCRA